MALGYKQHHVPFGHWSVRSSSTSVQVKTSLANLALMLSSASPAMTDCCTRISLPLIYVRLCVGICKPIYPTAPAKAIIQFA